MDNPILLPYSESGISDGEIIRRKYLIDFFNYEQKVPEVKQFTTLNKRLDINKNIMLSAAIEPTVKHETKILFAVGTGAENVNINYLNNTIQYDDLVGMPTYVSMLDPETFADEGDLDTITHLKVLGVSEPSDPSYMLYKPEQYENSWFRRFYTKTCDISKDMIAKKAGYPVKTTQVRCTLTKADFNVIAGSSEVPITSFNELTLYFGKLVQIRGSKKILPPAYFTPQEPGYDCIDVVPFYHVVFEDILVADIPVEGLTLVFEIITDDLGMADASNTTT